ncbi:MAG: bifunctional (p)ppGpp synthetase/guanosine-3',5'-bis(diphosphate) 3'-pyrophosphohydrolase [Prevotella sp.]|nr:bifunctional (p)ppGpp synthetase/guanosine-3',5'-bis(diphosphate) 3'-pyrophosphohydrolase [Prevotella sp.]
MNDTDSNGHKPAEEPVQAQANNEEEDRQHDGGQMVDDAFQRLLSTYLASPHRKKTDIITKAFNFARQAHKGVKRLSGEPYIMHPIAVAQIACEEMGLGSTSICSALLHDVVEDTDYTVEDIEVMFGSKIAQIVDGLTKISGGIFGEQASAQAENFKKLLLTMSDDIRVILIKICDRLHNMRTLESQPANKQYKIAGETLYIYAPLANRLGLNKIKSELENLSFRFEHPEEYDNINKKLAITREQRNLLFEDFTAPIRETLDAMGIEYELKARVKSPYSIWTKMQNKHVTFDEIYDILAVRIIFTPKKREDEINECFQIYVAISKIYKSHPDRLRDWLNHPKGNGYQALHVTLMSHTGRWIEVQIRSDRMDEVAEQGFAAHWKYKEGDDSSQEVDSGDGELNDWLGTIKEILDDPQPDAMDFLDTIKLNLFASEIFVFTPKGEIMTMPAGCTALDFAFQIHTFLGTHCIGAKVNHKLVPLSHHLQSGDQVEILTSKSQHVQPSWLGFVSTAKAKGKIQASLRRADRETQKKGEQTLKEWLEKNSLELTSSVIDKLCDLHEIQRHDALFLALGKKTIILGDRDLDLLLGKKGKKGWKKFVPFIKSEKKEEKTIPVKRGLLEVGKGFNKKIPCYLTEETIQMYIFRDCCHPIPGDDILGFIDNKNHIEIHKRSCPVAARLKSSYGNRILDAKWEMHQQLLFDATIQIRGIDRKGMILDLGLLITNKLDINIRRITVTSEEGIFDGTIELRVHDRSVVAHVMEHLKTIRGIQEVSQIM